MSNDYYQLSLNLDDDVLVNYCNPIRETGKEYVMSKMTLNRASELANLLCIKLDCRTCPIKDECSQFARVHKHVPTMYLQNEIKKVIKNGKI